MGESSRHLDSLYQEILLDHHRDPRNFGEILDADCHSQGFNPMCGDKVEVSLKFSPERKVLLEGKFKGQGCSICMASASMMMEEVNGKPLSDILESVQCIRDVMQAKREDSALEGDLASLAGVKRFPVRIKCVLLPWTTLKAAIEKGCTAMRKHSIDDFASKLGPDSFVTEEGDQIS